MMKTLFLTLPTLVSFVLAAPTTRLTVKRDAEAVSNPNSYIVVLKDTASRSEHLDSLTDHIAADSVDTFAKIVQDDWEFLNGYEAVLKGAALEQVLTSPEVAYVEENVFVSAAQYFAAEPVKRAEIEERAAQAQNGAGVDIFSIDTGIYIEHQEFGNPSRASWGATFGDSTNADGNGSGTFTSCIAAGQSFGVAREANVIAVKALDDQGRSTLANIVSAINYVGVQATFSNRPAIATIGIGSVSSNAIDQAVASIISNPGVHVVVGAGSGNNDVNNYSPARVWQAVTVGTVDTQQRKASFSNYGNAIDVWAPGVSITCAWIGSAWTTTTLSGSSASMAYVAGVLAVAISRYGNKKPADLVKDLTQHARGSVQGNPSGTTNLLAQVW